MTNISLVPPTERDIPFMRSTYVLSQQSQVHNRYIRKELYKSMAEDDLHWVIQNGTTKVIYLRMDDQTEDQAIGWISFRGRHLLFLYIKQAYRRNRIATKVLEDTGFNLDQPQLLTSHLNFFVINRFPDWIKNRISYIPLHVYKRSI